MNILNKLLSYRNYRHVLTKYPERTISGILLLYSISMSGGIPTIYSVLNALYKILIYVHIYTIKKISIVNDICLCNGKEIFMNFIALLLNTTEKEERYYYLSLTSLLLVELTVQLIS